MLYYPLDNSNLMHSRNKGGPACLNLTVFNQFYAINKICGQEKQRHYLESLGFVPGARISILSELHGYYLVMVKGSKIGLDKSLAKKIIVYAS